MSIVITHDWSPGLIDQRFKLHDETQNTPSIFQITNAQGCGFRQGNEELAFVHGIRIILQLQATAKGAEADRDATDLDALTAELVRVVQETMQPERVSVWLLETKGPKVD